VFNSDGERVAFLLVRYLHLRSLLTVAEAARKRSSTQSLAEGAERSPTSFFLKG